MKKAFVVVSLMVLFAWVVESRAASYAEANWYVTIDVDQVRSTILPVLSQNKSVDAEFAMQKHSPQGLEQISVYGHSEDKEDLSFVVSGEFNTFEVSEYINSLMFLLETEEAFDVVLFDSVNHNSRVIEEYRISGKSKTKSFYSAKVNDGLIVLSLDQNEVKRWVDNKYNANELQNSGLISVLINIESAMAHMGADLNSHKGSFNSTVFKKINQFSASVFESGNNITIESALSTADEATAQQLEQVLNGLIAMNALSNLDDKNPLLSALASGLTISNQGNELLLSSEIALSLIAEIDLD